VTYEDLLQRGKKVFNFSPNDNFNSVEQILEVASDELLIRDYVYGSALYGKTLAAYCDAHPGKLK